MNQFVKTILVSSLALTIASPAHALFELRAHGGVNIGDADASNVTISGSEEFPTVPAAIALGADALFYLPLMPLGFGARYERFMVGNEGDVKFDLGITRISGVVNYRLIDTLIYVGPIATIGLVHDNSLEISGISGVSDRTYTSEMDAFSTFSIGVEAGMSLIGLNLGAELGHMVMNMANPKTSGGEELGTDINFTGMYAKILVGIGF